MCCDFDYHNDHNSLLLVTMFSSSFCTELTFSQRGLGSYNFRQKTWLAKLLISLYERIYLALFPSDNSFFLRYTFSEKCRSNLFPDVKPGFSVQTKSAVCLARSCFLGCYLTFLLSDIRKIGVCMYTAYKNCRMLRRND